jgi:hypothetical protein
MAYRVTTVATKLNDSDAWVSATTEQYFTEEEMVIVNNYKQTINNVSGISNQTLNVNGNTTTYSYDAVTLSALNEYEITSSSHAFIPLRNSKLRELNIPQYLYRKTIAEI